MSSDPTLRKQAQALTDEVWWHALDAFKRGEHDHPMEKENIRNIITAAFEGQRDRLIAEVEAVTKDWQKDVSGPIIAALRQGDEK